MEKTFNSTQILMMQSKIDTHENTDKGLPMIPMIGHRSCPSECRRRNRCHGTPGSNKTSLESYGLVLEWYCLMINRMHYFSLLFNILDTYRAVIFLMEKTFDSTQILMMQSKIDTHQNTAKGQLFCLHTSFCSRKQEREEQIAGMRL